MSKRFRGKAVVVRRKYFVYIPAILPLLLLLSVDVKVPKSMHGRLFHTALICIESNATGGFGAESLFRTACLAFAGEPGEAVAAEYQEVAVQPAPSLTEPAAAPPDKAISIPSYGLEMRNQTSYTPDSAALLEAPLPFLPVETDSAEPQVLIVHTHTTESFAGEDRTDDEARNVVAIGKVIADFLTERGINTLHCKTVHDYDYNLSYSKSADTVSSLLAQYPSVKIVLDVHRDGITYEDGSGLRVIADTKEGPVAQFMLVLGTDEGGLSHPAWQTNLSFGFRLQSEMNSKYPGFARPLNLRQERFNQNLSPGMLIVECGGNSNSIEEVKSGALLFSQCLYSVITKQQG